MVTSRQFKRCFYAFDKKRVFSHIFLQDAVKRELYSDRLFE